MEVFVGTSGWYYEWNRDKTLDWYVANSGINAIELNVSFYRFPFPNQVKAWAKKGRSLRWVIKVSRLITHRFKFSDRSVETWKRFVALFSIMSDLIDFFLLQIPPSLTSSSRDKIADFIEQTGMAEKFALEPRHDSWFNDEIVVWARAAGLTWVSIDAPIFTRDIFKTTDSVYLRMHGRTDWYQHDYKSGELKEISKRVYAVKPKRAYVFFNNDHSMLGNAQDMYGIMSKLKG
ncbi:hypothetical protein AMJ83_07880 [candidate division WOR_3 bacterium SM23_42]|uniref:DUF72 domain-containing protein n=1 Tax=candidate division WOR_3 bacterium SM23_42 TaxID=1703779 RepID=A0A0S8FUG7_UNCW3|nr:MAG: hypothetical protein AMJ83_07880 [candidate division WOR_3 bacterium SM23_42]